MVVRWTAILLLAASLAARASDVPPVALVQENVRKASAILRGRVESAGASTKGVTVTHFRVAKAYRGAFKAGDVVDFASFKEQDRYNDVLLHNELVVFLVKRRQQDTPAWETATDLSEFVFTPQLDSLISKQIRRRR